TRIARGGGRGLVARGAARAYLGPVDPGAGGRDPSGPTGEDGPVRDDGKDARASAAAGTRACRIAHRTESPRRPVAGRVTHRPDRGGLPGLGVGSPEHADPARAEGPGAPVQRQAIRPTMNFSRRLAEKVRRGEPI